MKSSDKIKLNDCFHRWSQYRNYHRKIEDAIGNFNSILVMSRFALNQFWDLVHFNSLGTRLSISTK